MVVVIHANCAQRLEIRPDLALESRALRFENANDTERFSPESKSAVKLETPAGPGMDTDIVTLGPLLLGGGAGYSVPLGDKGRLIADVSAILGLPVIKEVGGYPMNAGAQIDATLGVQFGF